jgi:hypothetical protein
MTSWKPLTRSDAAVALGADQPVTIELRDFETIVTEVAKALADDSQPPLDIWLACKAIDNVASSEGALWSC